MPNYGILPSVRNYYYSYYYPSTGRSWVAPRFQKQAIVEQIYLQIRKSKRLEPNEAFFFICKRKSSEVLYECKKERE